MKPGNGPHLTRWLFEALDARHPAWIDDAPVVQPEPDWASEALALIKQGMVLIDASGTVRKLNASAGEILGFNARELLGKSCMTIAPPEIQLMGDRFLDGLLRQSPKIKSHWVLRHKSGAYVTVVAHFKSVLSPAFGASCLITFALDDKADPTEIAQRTQSEREASQLAASHGMLQQLINNIPARIAYFDCATLQCVFGNEAFALGHGLHVKALAGKTASELLPPASWTRMQKHFERAMRGETTRFEHTETDESCAPRHIEVDLMPHMAQSGQQIGIFALAVQALRASELRLNQALATEKELGTLKTAFVSMASHELRTPLTAIQSASDLLLHYGARLNEGDRVAAFADIQGSVKRMTAIMENILIFGRIGYGAHTVPTQISMQALMEGAAAEVSQAYPRQDGIRIHCESLPHGDANGDDLATVDEFSLHHIVGNLLSNACKYSPPDQAVELHWSRQCDGTGEWLSLRVCDHGIGIPAQDMPHLFETFHRASNVGKTPGTGLGLPIV
jgi:PAS domain S-box-containing protein